MSQKCAISHGSAATCLRCDSIVTNLLLSLVVKMVIIWWNYVQVCNGIFTLPSSRHHLSCNDCLEDNVENCQNCSILCCVRQLCTMIHMHKQFLKMGVGLGLGLFFVHLFRFSILWLCLQYFVLVLFPLIVLGLVSSVLCQEIGLEQCFQCIRDFTTMRYINLRFTYLLTSKMTYFMLSGI